MKQHFKLEHLIFKQLESALPLPSSTSVSWSLAPSHGKESTLTLVSKNESILAGGDGGGERVWKDDMDDASEEKEGEGDAGDFPSREEEGERTSSSFLSRRGPMGSAIRNECSVEGLSEFET